MQVIGCFFTKILIAKYGRKPLLQVGTFIATGSHLLVALGFYYKFNEKNDSAAEILVIVGLFLFISGYSFSLGPIIWLYIPEIVPSRLVPWALVIHWVTSFMVLFLFPVITDNVLDHDPTIIFIFLASYLLVSMIIN